MKTIKANSKTYSLTGAKVPKEPKEPKESGAVMLEFVIIFPILVMLVFGIISLGLVTSEYQLYDLASSKVARKISTGKLEVIDCSQADIINHLSESYAELNLALPDFNASPNESLDVCIGDYLEVPYFKIGLRKNMSCFICQVGLGFDRLARLEENYLFIIEKGSTLMPCYIDNLLSCS